MTKLLQLSERHWQLSEQSAPVATGLQEEPLEDDDAVVLEVLELVVGLLLLDEELLIVELLLPVDVELRVVVLLLDEELLLDGELLEEDAALELALSEDDALLEEELSAPDDLPDSPEELLRLLSELGWLALLSSDDERCVALDTTDVSAKVRDDEAALCEAVAEPTDDPCTCELVLDVLPPGASTPPSNEAETTPVALPEQLATPPAPSPAKRSAPATQPRPGLRRSMETSQGPPV